GDVYVLERRGDYESGTLPFRILRYRAETIAAAVGGGNVTSPADEVVLVEDTAADAKFHRPGVMRYDRTRNGLCLQSQEFRTHCFDLQSRQFTIAIGSVNPVGNYRGVDVYSQGGVWIVDAWGPPARYFPGPVVDSYKNSTTPVPLEQGRVGFGTGA